ncbi:MAG: DNA topoisomerase IB [Ferruginibacter sp.]
MELKQLTHRRHVRLVKDYEATAVAANLLYVSDKDPGIVRIRKTDTFQYKYLKKSVKEKAEIKRIQQLAIPPAWEEVWICVKQNGHIQATGYDIRNRKQYRYHPLWNLLRNQTKFHKLLEFARVLPTLRLQVEKDLGLKELSEKKVIAAIISLMERTYIRIGNAEYEKMNGSHGLTTMHDEHVKIEGEQISFSFLGKKSIHHDISLKNKKLAKVVKQCRDIPGKTLFQYYDHEGERRSIDSGMVNAYIKEVTGDEFTAKDFRTWAGCLHLLMAFKNIGIADNVTTCKKNINKALDIVSSQLGNTRTVCKKYYVHPGLIQMYEENKLNKYLNELDHIETNDNTVSLTKEEKLLTKILSAL